MLMVIEATEKALRRELTYNEAVSIADDLRTGLGELRAGFESEMEDAPAPVIVAAARFVGMPFDAFYEMGLRETI